ncbi:MAG: glycosyl hydrolase family 65 protein [Acutalibacteraceae bacterium]|nr:glycosyl hydrolase family 65 protein [Acutalibacteraceae bacterium]
MKIGLWKIEETEFLKDKVEQNGSRFLIANGYMGYRGTLEEFGKEQLVALNMAGLFDRNGDLWRESVNAPNPFYIKTCVGQEELSTLTGKTVEHNQTLDIQYGVHSRKTVFEVNGAKVTLSTCRFLSMKNENLAAIRYTLTADKEVSAEVTTFVDSDVWSINGEHFAPIETRSEKGVTLHTFATTENKIPITVYEYINGAENENKITLKAGEEFSFVKYCGIYWGDRAENTADAFAALCAKDFETHFMEHKTVWESIWSNSDVQIEGDEEAQFALRYSIYHLSSIVPRNTDKCAIPARGLSGQVYKGAAFWDTEMFMMPFFSFTDTKLCKNLAKYRINTMEGAKRKAVEFGYEGAFYPWESQETGDDACTLFNVTDIFTNRPMRTHFKDAQIHISADVVYGLWEYCNISGDYSLLFEGGLEMMYQCFWFFYSFSVYKPLKNRYELRDVVGPDEYHERVNNNAFTNKMVAYTAEAFHKALRYAKENNPEFYKDFTENHDVSPLNDFIDKLYIPAPGEDKVIEQFDGYFKLEDISLSELKSRIIIPNEYLGGGNGLATTTRILKQADVLMMLNVFRSEYSEDIKKANWEYYEPYTEHGSSLSACAYGIVAAGIGMPDWAYKYFMKTATVDLTGDTKQYLGTIYIGGTHPAANGGSWNTAVFGFGGVSYTDDALDISPSLPAHWNSISFKLLWRGVRLSVTITKEGVNITADKPCDEITVTVNKKKYNF